MIVHRDIVNGTEIGASGLCTVTCTFSARAQVEHDRGDPLGDRLDQVDRVVPRPPRRPLRPARRSASCGRRRRSLRPRARCTVTSMTKSWPSGAPSRRRRGARVARSPVSVIRRVRSAVSCRRTILPALARRRGRAGSPRRRAPVRAQTPACAARALTTAVGRSRVVDRAHPRGAARRGIVCGDAPISMPAAERREVVQSREELPVVLGVLREPQAGVEHDLLGSTPATMSSATRALELVPHVGHHVGVGRERSTSARAAPVHGHEVHAGLGDDAGHAGVGQAARHVVDDRRPGLDGGERGRGVHACRC